MEILIISLIVITFLFNTWLSILNYRNKDAEISDEVIDVYNQNAYQNWLKYSMENFRLSIISETVRLVIMLSLLIFKVFPIFYDFACALSNSVFTEIVIFVCIYFFINYMIRLIFSYYNQFNIEEKYGFNNSTKQTFSLDKTKGILLTIIFGGGIIYLVGFLCRYISNLNQLYALIMIVYIIVTIFINLFYVKLILPLFNKLTPLEEGELKEKIIIFTEKVGYEVTKISIMNASKRSTKINAFISGFGKFKRIVLYDTLINKMSPDQVISILAHEIGHAKHKHIIKNIFITILHFSIYFAVLMFFLNSYTLSTTFGFSNANSGFGLIIAFLLISPISILLAAIENRFSRKHEYKADYYAVVNGFKSEIQEALKILARENYNNLTPHPFFVAMKYSHPPIAYRIRAIREIEE